MTQPSRAMLGLIGIFLLAQGPLCGDLYSQKLTPSRVDTGQASDVFFTEPQIAAIGNEVYVVWPSRRDGAWGLYLNRSQDGGSTWLTEALKIGAGTGPYFRFREWKLAVQGDSVFVIWLYSQAVFFNRSQDKGASWLPEDVRLDLDEPHIPFPEFVGPRFPSLTVVGDSVYAAWVDARPAAGLRFSRSLDGGATWWPSARHFVDQERIPGYGIEAFGNSVYFIWSDRRRSQYAADTYFNRSLDNGSNWLPSERLLSQGYGWLRSSDASGDSVYFLRLGEVGYVLFSCSLDGGITWPQIDFRIDSQVPSKVMNSNPIIKASGDRVYAVWRGGTATDVRFNRSLDRGRTWFEDELQVNRDFPGLITVEHLNLAVSGDSVYVAWVDKPRGLDDCHVYFNRSVDAGSTWLGREVMLSQGGLPAFRASIPRMTSTSDSVYVTWVVEQTEGLNVYMNIPFGSQPYGEGSPGTGSKVPYLEATDSLNVGRSFTLSITNGLGRAFGLLALGGHGSQACIPVPGGALLVDPIERLVPILLGGTSGLAGDGSYSVDIEIPDDNALLGFNINAQAILVDPEGDFGVSFSNGIEAWIL